jgi:hypothetical protein
MAMTYLSHKIPYYVNQKLANTSVKLVFFQSKVGK